MDDRNPPAPTLPMAESNDPESPTFFDPAETSHRVRRIEDVLSTHDVGDHDAIELGVCAGQTTYAIAAAFNRRITWACDTWEGLPDDCTDFDGCKPYECAYPFTRFADNMLKARKLDPGMGLVVPVKGRVENTLVDLQGLAFSFAWVDLDLYRPTRYGAFWLAQRMAPGGIIGFHDYGFERCAGVKVVVHELLEAHRGCYELLPDRSFNCAFLRRVG